MGQYYDREGNVITEADWLVKFKDNSVAWDEIGDVQVSTMWLGRDQSREGGPPLIFETMCFGGPYNQECRRYSTEQQAREGHCEMVEKVRVAKEGC